MNGTLLINHEVLLPREVDRLNLRDLYQCQRAFSLHCQDRVALLAICLLGFPWAQNLEQSSSS